MWVKIPTPLTIPFIGFTVENPRDRTPQTESPYICNRIMSFPVYVGDTVGFESEHVVGQAGENRPWDGRAGRLVAGRAGGRDNGQKERRGVRTASRATS